MLKSESLRFALFIYTRPAMKRALSTLLIVTLGLAACRQTESHHNASPSGALIDDLGHSVALSNPPRRIVSVAPSLTEIVYLLGSDSSLVGVTDYCDYPEAAKKKARIGGMLNPSIERILALDPDLVLMSGSGNLKSDYDQLTSAGVRVFVSYPRSIEGVLKSIRDCGVLTGRQPAADSMTNLLRARCDSLSRFAATRKGASVLMLLSLNPLIAIGPGTFLNELLTMANGKNIVRDSSMAYPVISREEVIRRQPDVIIATNDIVRSKGDILAAYPEWKSLTAIRNGRVTLVDASCVSRPGPRIVDGLESILHAIHGNGTLHR